MFSHLKKINSGKQTEKVPKRKIDSKEKQKTNGSSILVSRESNQEIFMLYNV